MGYTDIHCHILPSVDDGAKTIDDSIALLRQEKENDVTTVILTPHFYPNVHSLDEYTEKCHNSFCELKKAICDMELPDIYLGYEVQYFPGISRCQTLDKLSISGSHYLLLELPFLSPLTHTMLNEIIKINQNLGLTVIIAHIERYKDDKLFKSLLKLIKNGDALAQISADFILDKNTKKTVSKLLKSNFISYIASDAHSVTERPVLIKKALKHLRDKYYPQVINCIKNCEHMENILKGNTDA